MTLADTATVPLDALRSVLAPLGTCVDAQRLTGGLFATSYRATLDDGTRVVVKTAPVHTDALLRYELDLLRTEALVYRLAEGRDLLTPRVLLTDWSRTALPSDVVVVTHLDGVPLSEAGFGPVGEDPRADRAQRDLGALMARWHRLHGERFGYPNAQTGLVADTWGDAYTVIVEALLTDAARWGTSVPAEAVRALVAKHRPVLDTVTQPTLVHTDLWAGNLFVDPETGALTGVIDPERALWGDPLADLVDADAMSLGPVAPGLLAGYADEGTTVDVDDPAVATRLDLYRLHITLVMVVELAPRAYEGDWVAGYTDTLWSNLDALVTRLS